jgi:hypothetical protein
MTEPKWTPGPWTATHSDPAQGADVWWITATPASNQETDIATVSGGKWPIGKSEANAMLISSAPELYRAVKLLLSSVDHLVGHLGQGWQTQDASREAQDACEFSEAALAKARGES